MNDAIIKQDIEKIDEILNEGFDINQKDENNRTPIGFTAVLNFYEPSYKVFKYLLDKGADPTIKSNNRNVLEQIEWNLSEFSKMIEMGKKRNMKLIPLNILIEDANKIKENINY